MRKPSVSGRWWQGQGSGSGNGRGRQGQGQGQEQGRCAASCPRQHKEGTFARRATSTPGIQINIPAIHPNAVPLNIAPSSSPGYLTPAVPGAHVLAEWRHHPCLLGVPTRRQKYGKKGGTTEKIGGNHARCARRPTVPSKSA